MLGHQAHDGLVGIVVDVSPEDEHRRAKEHEKRGERGEEPRLAPPSVEDRGDHDAQQYSRAIIGPAGVFRLIFAPRDSALGLCRRCDTVPG